MTEDLPPVPEGYVRIFEDHTGRWYEDIPQAEYDRRVAEALNDPFLRLLREEIDAEIDREIIASIKESRT